MLRPFDLIYWSSRYLLWRGGMRRRLTRVGGHEITYWEGGRGETVLLIHGLNGSTLADFRQLASGLAKRYRVISVDLPGFGLSTHVPMKQSVANQAGFVLGFLDAIGLDASHVLGNSMGGWVALKLAERHPARVKSLVLTASAGIHFEHPPLEVFTPEDTEGLKKLLWHICYQPPSLPGFFMRDWLRVMRLRRHSVREMLDSMQTAEDAMEAHLPGMRVPTLILWGDSDRLIPPDTGKRMAAMMPDARLEVIERCGHLLLHEHHPTVLAHVERFLGDRG